MRGTLACGSMRRKTFGIIPAYAGNTMIVSVPHVHWWDHPRVCGEHLAETVTTVLKQGSSPRMRGTRRRTSASVPARRIIPAYAGNTELLLRRHHWCRDHPRVCGEHLAMTSVACERTGSSPRMRGTRPDRQPQGRGQIIIPAYAGNTSSSCSYAPSYRDHPRVCGEHRV